MSKPNYINVSLQDLLVLTGAYLAAVKGSVGNCSMDQSSEELLSQINAQSSIQLTEDQLENLLYHFRESCAELEAGLNPDYWYRVAEKIEGAYVKWK